MAILQSQASFPMFTMIPRDVITNTMHWETTLSTSAAADIIATRLDTFYTAVYALAESAASYVTWSQGSIKVYNLDDLPPRVAEERALVVTTGTPKNTEVPTEVSVVLSYHAGPIGGVANARLRNRIYLGGIAEGAILPGSTTAFPLLGSSFITAVCNAAAALKAANNASLWWVQYSPTRAQAELIVGGWVDNSFDTQRRRGVEATSRTLFT